MGEVEKKLVKQIKKNLELKNYVGAKNQLDKLVGLLEEPF